MSEFDPSGVGIKGNIFGLPYSVEDADLILIPVPWEVTVSYRAGTADAPAAILEASTQVDLFLRGLHEPWNLKISMLPIPREIQKESDKFRALASSYIQSLEEGSGQNIEDPLKVIPRTINENCEKLNIYLENTCRKYMSKGKLIGVIGGDHSTPLGFIRALARKYDSFGILQIDAHADLRKAYENFAYSHASIMYNALLENGVDHLVQVGIRDFCEEEVKIIESQPERIKTFYDDSIHERLFRGDTWHDICEDIIEQLPDLVYISFDIDGLNPSLCPNTGTPVPGGLSWEQATYLVRLLVKEGKQIIGFDLNEVAPGEDEWDANVAARLTYFISCWMGASNGKILSAN